MVEEIEEIGLPLQFHPFGDAELTSDIKIQLCEREFPEGVGARPQNVRHRARGQGHRCGFYKLQSRSDSKSRLLTRSPQAPDALQVSSRDQNGWSSVVSSVYFWAFTPKKHGMVLIECYPVRKPGLPHALGAAVGTTCEQEIGFKVSTLSDDRWRFHGDTKIPRRRSAT